MRERINELKNNNFTWNFLDILAIFVDTLLLYFLYRGIRIHGMNLVAIFSLSLNLWFNFLYIEREGGVLDTHTPLKVFSQLGVWKFSYYLKWEKGELHVVIRVKWREGHGVLLKIWDSSLLFRNMVMKIGERFLNKLVTLFLLRNFLRNPGFN